MFALGYVCCCFLVVIQTMQFAMHVAHLSKHMSSIPMNMSALFAEMSKMLHEQAATLG